MATPDAGERDGLADDVVRREEEIRQPPVPEAFKDLPDTGVVVTVAPKLLP